MPQCGFGGPEARFGAGRIGKQDHLESRAMLGPS